MNAIGFMKRVPATVACALLLVVTGGVCEADDILSGPQLACDAPVYDFGELENTRSVDHEFILRNEGAETLEIIRVHSGCGCTVAKPNDMKIRPGGETAIRVRFSLKGRTGRQAQKVTVISDDPFNPRLDLTLTGEALSAITVNPERLFWGNIHKDEPHEQVVAIKFHRDLPVSVKSAVIQDPMFSVETKVVSDGESYEVVIKTAPDPAPGPFDCALRVETDARSAPDIVVPMSGRVVGDVYAVPHEIILDSRSVDLASRFIIVRSARNLPFKVLEVESPDESIEVSVRQSGASRYMVDLKKVAARPGLDGAVVRIITDCETDPEILVPIRVMDFGEDGL